MPDLFPVAVPLLLADDLPVGEATTPTAGTGGRATREDHRHPRLTSSTVGTTDAGGHATIAFTRSFAAQPSCILCAVEDNTSPVPSFKVRSWVMSGGLYTGCVVYGSRSKALPTTPTLSGIALLGALVTGVNNLIGLLSGFTPYEPAAGVGFTCIALQTSTT